MLDTNGITSLQNGAQELMASRPELAIFGLVAGVGVVLVLTVLALRLIWTSAQKLRGHARARAFRRDKAPGHRILFANVSGRGGGPLGKALLSTLFETLPRYNFGAPFRVMKLASIQGGHTPEALAKARRRLARADADMIVWGQRTSRGSGGLRLYCLSRGGGLSPENARFAEIALPGDAQAWSDPLRAGAVYLLAKCLQPGLENPGAFRPEKTKQLASTLQTILASNEDLPLTVKSVLEADFCAAAIHTAEKGVDAENIDQVIALRRAHLSDEDFTDPAGILQARIDLGRALIARSEKTYDASVLKEAIEHLSHAVEVLREDPAIQRAQSTSDAMFKAQTMIENRKRFSLNFGA